MKRIGLLLLFVIFGLVNHLLAQTPDFKSFVFDGAESVKVQALAQDAKHHLYFGTSKGLLKYDGLKSKMLPFPDSISNLSVTALLYQNDLLLIGTSTGEMFSYDGEMMTTYQVDGYTAVSKINTLKSVGNCIGIATYGDGVYLVQDGKLLKHYNTNNGLGDDYTYDLEMHSGRLWVGTDAGVTEIDTSENATYLYSMRNGLPDNIVKSITTYNDSTIAIGMYDLGLCFFNTKNYKFNYLNGEQNWNHGPVQKMVLASDNVLWIATKSDGIVWVELIGKEKKIRAFSAINGLESNRIETLFEDAERNVWIGTNIGASIYTGSSTEFLTKAEGLPAENIYDVLVDREGNYWLASDRGVIRYKLDNNGQSQIKLFMEHEGQLDRQIVTMIQNNEGHILMGSYGGGLFDLDPITERITRYTEADGLQNSNILDLAEDQNGKLWLGTLGAGVICATKKEGRYDFHRVDEIGEYLNAYVYSLFLDHKQQLWVGMDGSGVAVLDSETERFRNELEGLPKEGSIYSITEDLNGAIWFATDDAQLLEYNQGRLTDHAESAGLNGATVQSLVTTSGGDVMAFHKFGIAIKSSMDEDFILHSVSRNDYVFSPNLNAAFVSENGIWTGTESGAIKWKNSGIDNDEILPKVELLGMQVLYEDQPMIQNAEFDYSQSHFVFQYHAVWLKAPEDVTYQYMLQGFDKNWSFSTKSELVTYSSLPPGNYTFMVRASSDGLHWSSSQDSSYTFEINKPFWMQWWFYLALLVFAGISVRSLVRYRTQKLIADKQLLEEEVQKRTAEITEQKEIIEHKNDEILSSITYAKRIQTAILPPEHFVKTNLPQSFILYKPKDIVAGDFYWMTSVSENSEEDENVLFASADCTGHGVPGAMVSVVCSNAMNRAVREYDLHQPAAILDKTRELVIERFEKSEEEVKDGMDVALCAYNPKSRILEYAGANNPLWIVSKRADITETPMQFDEYPDLFIHEIKADKEPIGKYAAPTPYTNHCLKLEVGDLFYVFTDGFADQFGGPRGKKLKYKPFKQILLSLYDQSMEDQHNTLDAKFEDWRGTLEQVDDVCVIGVRIA